MYSGYLGLKRRATQLFSFFSAASECVLLTVGFSASSLLSESSIDVGGREQWSSSSFAIFRSPSFIITELNGQKVSKTPVAGAININTTTEKLNRAG